MKQGVVFLGCTQETAINAQTTAAFYRLYQQAVLLALKEQGVLTDCQVQYGLARIKLQEGRTNDRPFDGKDGDVRSALIAKPEKSV